MNGILTEIEAFLARNPEVTHCRLGQDALHDPSLVSRLRKTDRPRVCKATTAAKVAAYMQSYERRKATEEGSLPVPVDALSFDAVVAKQAADRAQAAADTAMRAAQAAQLAAQAAGEALARVQAARAA